MKTAPRKFLDADEVSKSIFSSNSNNASSLCLKCRGAKLLCGKERCPILVKFYSSMKTKPLIDSISIHGSTPPSVFIGREGYPKVNIGPMLPPIQGDTSFIDTPEQWIGRGIDDIVDFRMKLVRGKYLTSVHDFSGKIVEFTREIALAAKSVDMEVTFKKKPRGNIALYDEVQPHGPSAPIKKVWLENPRVEPKIERAFYDGDLKAKDALLELYNNGVLISRMQKAFSVGAFGIEENRKFVPTRWSITAVDSTIGNEIKKKVKEYPFINEYCLYETHGLDNRWLIFMYPSAWEYELIEAWYPNTTWNPSKRRIVIFGDHEFYKGRSTYATIGGCYYAARLAAAEALNRERRQAGVVILREIHPGYIMPVGVWNVRENVRDALRKEPLRFDTFQSALMHISQVMNIPLERWIETSELIKGRLYQCRLDDFLKP
ncbi:MAG: Nre family DNA repair protein [Candidatus Thermoplasmatota archaeon]|nr:Nre family DNA repair protein [Candidatus Thermoplasmatota archaeon]